MKQQTKGLVLGKFLPLHKGHELLLKFAANFVDQLFIVVDRLENEVVPGQLRCKWVQQTVSNASVYFLDQINPQDPSLHPDFWNIWKNSLLNILPTKPDFVFASERYGFQLANVLNSKFISCDLNRTNISISATDIRKNLYENWHYLAEASKSDFLMRICIFGPESTGKTTLAQQLAEHFNTIYVPEYARFLIEYNGDVIEEDMLTIVQAQLAMENALKSSANKIIFCDTDPLLTSVWSKWLFNKCENMIDEIATRNHYDLYLLTDIDIAWEKDQVRYFPNHRKEFMDSCIEALSRFNRPYSIVKGIGKERTNNAIALVSQKAKEYFETGIWQKLTKI